MTVTTEREAESSASRKRSPSRPHAKPAPHPTSAAEREEMIRLAAYYLYVDNGCRSGRALDDWVAAEAQVAAAAEAAPPRARGPRAKAVTRR